MPTWWPFGRKPSTPLDSPQRIETPPVPVAVEVRPDPVPPDAPLEAGAAWCSRFPGSNRLEDLAEPFRTSAQRFVAHLLSLGCQVQITSTLRPEQRAWLMRMAYDIVHGYIRIDDVPVRSDIQIVWTLAGALAMVREYKLRFRPSLTSLHIQGLALDMRVVDWMGSDEALYDLGAEFGVHKLVDDPVHWSATGH